MGLSREIQVIGYLLDGESGRFKQGLGFKWYICQCNCCMFSRLLLNHSRKRFRGQIQLVRIKTNTFL